jgi:hypothetical protein
MGIRRFHRLQHHEKRLVKCLIKLRKSNSKLAFQSQNPKTNSENLSLETGSSGLSGEALVPFELAPHYSIATFSVKGGDLGALSANGVSTFDLSRAKCGRRRRSEVELAESLRRRSQPAPTGARATIASTSDKTASNGWRQRPRRGWRPSPGRPSACLGCWEAFSS